MPIPTPAEVPKKLDAAKDPARAQLTDRFTRKLEREGGFVAVLTDPAECQVAREVTEKFKEQGCWTRVTVSSGAVTVEISTP